MQDDDDFGPSKDITNPNQVALPDGKIPHSKRDPWVCRVCSYKYNVDARSPYCVQCGRDFWGNPGTIPDRQELAKSDLQARR